MSFHQIIRPRRRVLISSSVGVKNSDFIGKSAVLSKGLQGAKRTHVVFEVEADDADVVAYEPVWINGEVRGFCKSGGYSHFAQKSIAMALIPSSNATENLQV